ncbi:hypothetical protein FACS189413_14430 [Bacteroidia bacterium]|nr:hypothetical protein FACS189413_14430 [Bacteroidia bacterium]
MEAVLFDLYLTETAVKENRSFFADDSIKKAEWLQTVFRKHKITEEKFDTSLVWYNANLEKFQKINEKLNERYAKLIEDLRAEQDYIRTASVRMDTAYLYQTPAVWLQSRFQNSTFAFYEEFDSLTINRLQRYDVMFSALGIRDSLAPELTFCIQCKDTNFVFRDTIRYDGPFAKRYTIPASRYSIESVYGNLHLPDSCRQQILISRFAVFQQFTINLPADSIRNVYHQQKHNRE